MEEVLKELAKQLNLPQLIGIGIIFWFFYSRLDKKIEKLDVKFSDQFEKSEKKLFDKIEKLDEKLSSKIEKSDEKINSIDKTLFAVEAILKMKDCCVLSNEKNTEKAA